MAEMNKKIVLALPFLFPLGGCVTGNETASAPNLDMMAETVAPVSVAKVETRPRAIAADSAIAHLPEAAGYPKGVRERHYINGYWQEIALASDVREADSFIQIAIQNGKASASASANKAPVWKPGETGIRDELARAFPKIRMAVVTSGAYENRYGRFGLAIGRIGESLRCIYAWQYVDDARQSFNEGQRIPLDAGAHAAPSALRIKLCRADATIDELVGFVQHLTIAIPENYGAAETVAEAAPERITSGRAVAVAQVRRPAQRARPEPRQAPLYASPAPGAYPSAPDGPRYMAPVAGPAAAPATYGGAAPGALSPMLPPQAYRGPSAARQMDGQGATAGQNPYQRSSRLSVDATATGSIGARGRKDPQMTTQGAPSVAPLHTILDRAD
jgi:hypothetical protein